MSPSYLAYFQQFMHVHSGRNPSGDARCRAPHAPCSSEIADGKLNTCPNAHTPTTSHPRHFIRHAAALIRLSMSKHLKPRDSHRIRPERALSVNSDQKTAKLYLATNRAMGISGGNSASDGKSALPLRNRRDRFQQHVISAHELSVLHCAQPVLVGLAIPLLFEDGVLRILRHLA